MKTIDPDDTNVRAKPEDITVQINLRVPWHYRETLTKAARAQNRSLNRTIVNALVAQIPPER